MRVKREEEGEGAVSDPLWFKKQTTLGFEAVRLVWMRGRERRARWTRGRWSKEARVARPAHPRHASTTRLDETERRTATLALSPGLPLPASGVWREHKRETPVLSL